MIVVKVELHSARTGRVTSLAKLHITNDGSGNSSRGNYVVRRLDKNGRVFRTGRVDNYQRSRFGVLRLIRLAIDALK